MSPLDPVADIKARLTIEDVVSAYVPLTRTGRTLKAVCPFHNEKTPSFVVSPERDLAYCFGCNRGGDMFSFIQEIEGVDFKGALEILADRAGMDLSQYRLSSRGVTVSKDDKARFFSLNGAAKDFYSEYLFSTKEGAKVLKYLENRGLTAETILDFGLGLSPDSFDETYHFLVQKNYTKADLLELGLAMSKGTDSRKVYDRFRLRLMFPIEDAQGRVVGFGGRSIKKGDDPKYMNSPESSIYHKGRILYGFYRAKAAIRESDLAVIVEGYMDVIASHQVGVSNVVASSGTALTADQLKLIKRFTLNVAFAFDTDRAGEEALRRAIEVGQTHGMNMRVVRVPEGKDPDECIQQDPELWKQAISEAPNYLDYYLKSLKAQFDLSSIAGKRDACRLFLPLLQKASSLECDHFIKQLGFVLEIDPQFIYEEFNALQRVSQKRVRISRSPLVSESEGSHVHSNEDYFLGLLLRFPEQIESSLFDLPENLFESKAKTVYKSMSHQYNGGALVDVDALLEDFDEDLRKYCEVLMLLAETRNAELSEEMLASEMHNASAQLLRVNKKRLEKELMHEIRLAREANNINQERELFQQYSRLFQS